PPNAPARSAIRFIDRVMVIVGGTRGPRSRGTQTGPGTLARNQRRIRICDHHDGDHDAATWWNRSGWRPSQATPAPTWTGAAGFPGPPDHAVRGWSGAAPRRARTRAP